MEPTPVQQLISRMQNAPSQEWMDQYLELMRILFQYTKLASADPRVVTSLPIGRWFLPVSINNRYVLAPKRQAQVGIIYGAEFDLMKPEWRKQVVEVTRFKALPGEDVTDVPFFLYFATPYAILDSTAIQEGWLEAAENEVARAKCSPYRKFHQPIVYQVATNLDERKAVLKAAFKREQ